MAEKFPFSLNDAEHIICSTDYMVPGMNRVVFVYYSQKYGQIKAIEAMPPYLDPKGFKEYLLKENDIQHIKKIREEGNTYRWYSDAEIFFISGERRDADNEYPMIPAAKGANADKPKVKKDIQLSISGELERHTLMVAVKNEHDHNNDMLFYFYNKNLSNYQLSDALKPLDNKDKTIIGLKMYNMITLIVETGRSYRRKLKDILRDLNNKNVALKRALTESIDNNTSNHKALVNYAKEVLGELSAPLSQFVFELSESACRKLKDFHGDISFLKNKLREIANNKIIQNTDLGQDKDFEVEIEWEFDLEKNKQTIFIEDSDLNFDQIPEPQTASSVKMLGIDTSAIRLLNRLEEAAGIVKKKNLPLNASNVGKECKKNMSPPAISFALKKHQARIKPLLDKNKGKWPIIRKEFKPLFNILIFETTDREKLEKEA